jgi:hypothetical protein
MTYLQDYLRTSPSATKTATAFEVAEDAGYLEFREAFKREMTLERSKVLGRGKAPVHIASMLTLLEESYWDRDLTVAYALFAGTETPYVVRFVHRILTEKHLRPVAHMLTQKNLDTYNVIDVAFSGPNTVFALDRSTREGTAFEKDILLYLFENWDHVDAAAMLIERRAVTTMDELKNALAAMEGTTLPLLEGAL